MSPTPRLSMSDHRLLADIENAEEVVAAKDARDAAASKARVRAHIQQKIGPTVAAIDAALGRTACPRCGEPMTELEPRKAEPDTGVQAFAGGMGCDGCGAEVEDEEARDDQDRREDDGRRWGPSIFIPTFCLALCGLLIPAQPTPINDSLPSSSGLHDAGRATNPAPNRDGWRGFLYST